MFSLSASFMKLSTWYVPWPPVPITPMRMESLAPVTRARPERAIQREPAAAAVDWRKTRREREGVVFIGLTVLVSDWFFGPFGGANTTRNGGATALAKASSHEAGPNATLPCETAEGWMRIVHRVADSYHFRWPNTGRTRLLKALSGQPQ